MPELRGGPEAALQLLADALRARHNPPPGKRAAPTNGWTAADELELIMRRWRALLVGGKMGEITVGKRKADGPPRPLPEPNPALELLACVDLNPWLGIQARGGRGRERRATRGVRASRLHQ